MKIFVLGSTGMLGRYVDKYFRQEGYDVISITRNELDASTCTSKNLKDVGIKRDDVVINCIGLIKQRTEAADLEFTLVNSVFPILMADVCEDIGSKFIHVTTDCVFSGLQGSYDEKSTHDSQDVYGHSKSIGEPENATVIRTSIIGEEKANFLSLLEWVKSQAGKTVSGFTNHYWNGITCLQFSKICDKIIQKDLFWKGVKHIYSPDVLSKYDLVKLISEVYNLNITVNEFETLKKCDRTLKSERKDVVIGVPSLHQQLLETKDFDL